MSEIKRTDAIAGEIVHVYDGIEEADNALPIWWVVVFVGTLVFAAVYWLIVEEFHLAPTPAEELALVQAERAQRTGEVSEAELLALAQSSTAVSAGQQAFMTNCVACHGAKGEGNIGPNLTDGSWLHGGTAPTIFATIRDGVPAKGMPSWGPVLGLDAVKKITAYVLSIRGTNVPGKAAEGQPLGGS